MDRTTAKSLKRLKSNFIFWGGRIRKKGAESLSGTDKPEAVVPLISALEDPDEEVRDAARKTLTTLKDEAIDRFCAIWAEERQMVQGGKRVLESILFESNYLASAPQELHILTGIKVGMEQAFYETDNRGAEILLNLSKDRDPAIATTAKRVLLALKKEHTINHICTLWSINRDPLLESLLVEAGYVATNPVDVMYLTLLKQGKVEEAKEVPGEHVAILVGLMKDQDSSISDNALKVLCNLKKQEALNQLCKLWSIKRDPLLERMLVEAGYVATNPADVMCLTLLKQGRLEKAKKVPGEGVPILVGLMKDKDSSIRDNAIKVLRDLKRQEAVNKLCEIWMKNRDDLLKDIIGDVVYVASEPLDAHAFTSFLNGKEPKWRIPEEILKICLLDRERKIVDQEVSHIVKFQGDIDSSWLLSFLFENIDNGFFQKFSAAGWQPELPADRALFFFLAGDFENYNDIDFDHKHLRYWYETAEPKLKEAIAAGIRQSGQKSLLAVFLTERGSRKQKLSEAEVELQIEILSRKKDFPELFGLLPFTTCDQGLRIVAAAQEAGWQSPDRHNRELQQRLEALLKNPGHQPGPSSFAMKIFQDFRPMFMGSEKPPGNAGGLNGWLSDAGNFRRRSAALIHMAETSVAGLKEAANHACGDDYWQVRMAAAACELLYPGTLSPANRALLEDDHVYWVQALLKMSSGSGRVADLGPEGLEGLRRGGRRSDPKVKPEEPDDFFELLRGLIPDSEAAYLLTLGEFLGTDVVVSEEAAYAASETDIEIEMDE